MTETPPISRHSENRQETEMPGLYFEITADNKGFIRRATETRSAIAQTVSVAKSSGHDLDGMFTHMEGGLKRLAAAGAAAFTMTKAAQFSRDCINVRAEIQSLEISFETLLQNKDKARDMLGDIKQFAATTPMDMSSLAKGAQTMLGFNIEAEKVMPMLRAIGDISMGDAQKFSSLVLAFSQMSSTGRLMGQDLNQMINAGFNPLAEISEKTKKNISELKKEMEAGKISVQDVTGAFVSATSEGGKFHNMLQRQAEGLKGSFAYVRGSISDMMNGIGESLEGPVSKGVTLAGDLVKNYKTVGETIGVLVGMYGTYKTAVMVNAALDMSTIGRLRNLAKAKQLLTAVQSKLNATILMNPYGVAAAAVVGLTYAIYKLSTYQTDYQKSLKNLENSSKEYNSAIVKENQEIDILFNRLKSAKNGTEEWNKARNAVWSRYGSYLSSLGDEKTALNDVAAAYNLVRESAVKAAKARALDKYLKTEDESYAEDQADNYEEIKKIIEKEKGEKFTAVYEKDIRNIAEGRKKINKNFLALFDRMVIDDPEASTSRLDNKLGNAINKSLRRKALYDKAVAAGEDRYGIKRSELIPKNTDSSENADKSSREYWENEVKRRTEAYDKILKSDKEASAKALASLKEAEKELARYNDYKAQSKDKNGPTSAQIESKQDSSHHKILDLMKQQAEERLMLQQEYEMELWQNRINLMEEGEAKVLEQMKLDQAKEKYSLEERKKQAIQAEIQRQKAIFDAQEDQKATGNKKYARKVFNTDIEDSGNTDIDFRQIDLIEKRYARLYEDLEAMQKNSLENRLKEAGEALNSFLAEYGTYEQKRKAIDAQYDKQIKEAPTHGDRLKAVARKRKADADLDFQEWQENGGMGLAFGNLQNLSREMVDQLISDMERYRSKVISTFDPEKIKTYEEALDNLRNARIDIDYDGVDISGGLREAISLSQQFADKQIQIAELERQRKDIQTELGSLLSAVMTPGAGELVTSVTGLNGESLETGIQPVNEETVRLIDELRVKLVSVDGSLKAANNDSQNLEKRLSSVGKLKFKDFDKIAGQVQNVAGKASKLASVFDDDVADAIGEGAEKFGEMYDAIKDITSGFQTLVRNSGKTITDVVQASGQAVTKVSESAATSMKTIESASAILAIIAAAIQLATIVASLVDPDKKHEKNIEALQDRIDALQMSYARLERTTEKLYSADREESLRRQVDLLQKQRVAVAQQLIEEKEKNKQDKEAVKNYQERLQELDFEIEDIKAKAEDAIFGDDIKSHIENFSENYADAWEGGEDRAMSARDTVTEMMRNMVKESIKAATQGSAAMEQIRNSLTEFYVDGVLDKAEQDYIYGIADRLQKELDEQFAWANSLMTGDKFSQEASSRGFSSMSQDDGKELNGRFAALQESNERISQSVITMAGDLSAISSNVISIINVCQDIVNVHILNTGHLEEIAKNSRALAVMKETLENIERRVRNI